MKTIALFALCAFMSVACSHGHQKKSCCGGDQKEMQACCKGEACKKEGDCKGDSCKKS
jgi:hypothetical protein